MNKEKSQGDEFGAIGKQTMARAGGTEFGEKVKACAEQNSI